MHNYNISSTQHWFPCIAANWRARQHWKARRERWGNGKTLLIFYNLILMMIKKKIWFTSQMLGKAFPQSHNVRAADQIEGCYICWQLGDSSVSGQLIKIIWKLSDPLASWRQTTEWLKTLIILKTDKQEQCCDIEGNGNHVLFFQLWTVPEHGRFSYNLVIFAKGGIIYRFLRFCWQETFFENLLWNWDNSGAASNATSPRTTYTGWRQFQPSTVTTSI